MERTTKNSGDKSSVSTLICKDPICLVIGILRTSHNDTPCYNSMKPRRTSHMPDFSTNKANFDDFHHHQEFPQRSTPERNTPPPRNRSKNSATRRPTISPKHTFETDRQTTPIRSSLKQKRVAEPCSLQRPFSAPHVDFFYADERKVDEFAKFEILPIFVTATRKKRSIKAGCRWQNWWQKIFEPPFF